MHTDISRSRRLIMAAAATGATFVVEALVELLHPQAQPFTSPADYAIEALFALGLALAAVTWWGLRSSGAVDGRRGRIGAAIAAGGHAALALCATATVVNGADALGPVFMLGLLAALAGQHHRRHLRPLARARQHARRRPDRVDGHRYRRCGGPRPRLDRRGDAAAPARAGPR